MLQRVFVDTNCFLHLKDLKDVAWRDALPAATEIEIFVAPVVVDELDRLKTEKNQRIRTRCRAALSLIEEASEQPNMRLELRQAPLKVTLVVAQGKAINWGSFPRLDQTRSDDQLVATALCEFDDLPPTLISFDTGPLIRARSIGLSALRSLEAWALPPQKDEAERKISQLEAELAASRAMRPNVVAQILDSDGEGVVRLTIPQLEPISDVKQSRMLDIIKKNFPPRHFRQLDINMFGAVYNLSSASGDHGLSYQSEYEKFIANSRDQILNLHDLMAKALQFGEIRLSLCNNSENTANNLRIAMGCSENCRLFGSRSEMEKYGGAIRKINPPDPPRDIFDPPILPPSLMNFRESRRDPTAFYWLSRPDKGGDIAKQVCEEFRAKQRHIVKIYVFGKGPFQGRINFEATATNLSDPVKIDTKIILENGARSWSDPAVLRRLPEWMARVISD